MRSTGKGNEEVIFVGRKKRNFVCNVSNIYPEEIEEMLLQLSEIREAVVTKLPDKNRQFAPIYHICLNGEYNQKIVQNKIETLIQRTIGEDALPKHMVFTLTPLPRTDNGKLDAAQLERNDRQKFGEF